MISKNDSLVSVLDDYLIRLMKLSDPSIRASDEDQPSSGTETIGFLDRLKVFEAAARWVAIKNKIDTGDTEDEFARLRAGHVGRKGSSRAIGAASRTNGSA